jgi:hypothetical protein
MRGFPVADVNVQSPETPERDLEHLAQLQEAFLHAFGPPRQ